jgi:peptidoglycan/LPS O-acetylase OafA/YrhL
MYPLIDLLRASAALLVVVYHVIVLSNWTGFAMTQPSQTFRAGWV